MGGPTAPFAAVKVHGLYGHMCTDSSSTLSLLALGFQLCLAHQASKALQGGAGRRNLPDRGIQSQQVVP